MSAAARLRSWLQAVVWRSRMESQMDEELLFHMRSFAEDLCRQGIPPEEAHRQARLEFGGIDGMKEACREARGLGLMETLLQDVRFGLRSFDKSRSTIAILLITLALGIGANTAVFTLINGVMLRSLPVDHPEQLFFFGAGEGDGVTTGTAPSGAVSAYSFRFFKQTRENNGAAFDGITAFSPDVKVSVSLPGSDGWPRRFTGSLVDGGFFQVLGVHAIVGRMLTPEDDMPDNPGAVVVISSRYWTQSLGRDRQVGGRTLLINGAPFLVLGVAPPEFYGVRLNNPPDFWFPLSQQSFLMSSPGLLKQENAFWLTVLGRVRHGIDTHATSIALTTQLQQMMTDLEGSRLSPERARRIRESYVDLIPGASGLSVLRTRFSPRLHVLAVLVALVLMIACLNTANLLLARGAARQREMAIRLAVGAGRRRVVRQLMTESALLTAFGGLSGFVLAMGTMKLFSTMVLGKQAKSPFFSFAPDWRVFAFTFFVSLLTGILFGLAPAFRSTRVDLNEVLKDEFRNGTTLRLSHISPAKLLVSGQVIVSLALLMVAGLFLRSLRNLGQQELGFAPEQVLTCRMDLGASVYTTSGYKTDQLPGLYSRLIDRVQALPGVRSAALADAGLLGGSTSTSNISIEGYTQKPNENMDVQHHHVTWNYLQTNGLTLLAGRDISADDLQETPHVAVVNEAFAQRYFPGQNPMGHSFALGAPFHPPGMRIIGLVKNAKYNSLDEKTPALAFLPLLQGFSNNDPKEKDMKRDRAYVYGNELSVRVEGDPRDLVPALRQAIAGVDSNIPISNILPLAQRVSDSLRDAQAIAQLSSFFGIAALLLAAIGLYGVMAYSVSRRTHEIGIRLAIGAQPYDVLRMVLCESLLVVAIGVTLGIPAALGMGRMISSQLFGLSPRDPVTLALASLLLLLACMLATYVPARRASELDPMVALRRD